MPGVSEPFSIIENPNGLTWDDFVASRGGHILQSTVWGELKSRFGWRTHRIALMRNETMVAGAQILYRRLPLGLQFAYIPRGPVVDYNDDNTVAALFDALYHAAKSRGAFILKIEPNIPASNFQLATFDLHSLISNLVPSNAIQPRTTIHLDLTRDLATILAQMKPKWRYNIRLAERKGVRVREGCVDDLPVFYRLQQITSVRDHFAIHSAAYYRAAFELFTQRDYARLFVAEYASEPLAMIFVTAFGGEAIYLYGASSNEHRERMPNHALHWAAMQWAKARGCARYDLWGLGATTDADANTAHGLYQFKQGFGGQIVQYAGGYDAVFSKWQYALFARLMALRKSGLG
jgi:lipid II:glycine glycyltransferase (peptidoglycan interpeptide bridge formation enzyme)